MKYFSTQTLSVHTTWLYTTLKDFRHFDTMASTIMNTNASAMNVTER